MKFTKNKKWKISQESFIFPWNWKFSILPICKITVNGPNKVSFKSIFRCQTLYNFYSYYRLSYKVFYRSFCMVIRKNSLTIFVNCFYSITKVSANYKTNRGIEPQQTHNGGRSSGGGIDSYRKDSIGYFPVIDSLLQVLPNTCL